jgi:hypothetical protein
MLVVGKMVESVTGGPPPVEPPPDDELLEHDPDPYDAWRDYGHEAETAATR